MKPGTAPDWIRSAMSISIARAFAVTGPANALGASEGEIEQATYLREAFGLASDRGTVVSLMGSSRDVGSDSLRVPLTKTEKDDLQLNARMLFADQVSRNVIPFAEGLPTFAGAWFDQRANGRLVVALTKRDQAVEDKIRSMMPAKSRGLRFQLADSTFAQLDSAMHRAQSVASSVDSSAFIVSISINEPENRLELAFADGSDARMKAKTASLESRLDVAVKVRAGNRPVHLAGQCGMGGPGTSNCWSPLLAGVRTYLQNVGNLYRMLAIQSFARWVSMCTTRTPPPAMNTSI